MPDWQPVSVPDLCPRCGAYWECEHAAENARVEYWDRVDDTIAEAASKLDPLEAFTFNRLGSLGLARADDA